MFGGEYGRCSTLVRKTEQRNRKHNGENQSQVQEIPQRFEELCTRVNAQATQLENALKLHADKLTVKMNALEEEFTQKVNSLDSNQSLFEDVKEWLRETQESFNSRLDKTLKSLEDKLSASPVAEHSVEVKVETSTPLKSGLQPETSKFSSSFLVGSEDPEHKRPVQKTHRLTANRSGSPTLLSLKSSLD